MKNIILFIVAIIIAGLFLYLGEQNNKAYNKYMCANYGYYPDCRTKLPEELRLK